ncbi:hypothetical protein BT93_F2719 [Corymbia citriodora subsp. variegata]|nr:hypothetical protein BT93_F2719 [Corymbia citriodora subsp. variegata]
MAAVSLCLSQKRRKVSHASSMKLLEFKSYCFCAPAPCIWTMFQLLGHYRTRTMMGMSMPCGGRECCIIYSMGSTGVAGDCECD